MATLIFMAKATSWQIFLLSFIKFDISILHFHCVNVTKWQMKWLNGWMERENSIFNHCWDAFYAFRDKMHLHFIVVVFVVALAVLVVIVVGCCCWHCRGSKRACGIGSSCCWKGIRGGTGSDRVLKKSKTLWQTFTNSAKRQKQQKGKAAEQLWNW